jgi:hypothetical protein
MNVYVDSHESDKRNYDEEETGKEWNKHKRYVLEFF